MADNLGSYREIGVDFRVLAFTLGVSVLSAVIFGILPAWQGAKAEMNSVLGASSRGAGAGARHNRWRSILVIAEVALSFVLLIGARISIDDNSTGPRPVEISGIVGNVKQLSLEDDQTFEIYIPMAQIHEDGVAMVTNSQYWVVRSKTKGQSLETAFLGEVQKVDRDVASSNFRTMEDYLSESVVPRRFSLRLLTIFSIAALLLAVTGIYGVVSYTVTHRTPEIGIRLALGARRTQVFRLILGQGLKVVFVGLILGFAGALALSRVIRNLLFGVTPTDPLTFVLVSVLLIGVALIACCSNLFTSSSGVLGSSNP